MKIYLYSERNGWFEDKGLYLFDKPVIKAVYSNDILFLNNRKIKTKKPFLVIEKLIKERDLYCLGYISYDYGRKKLLKKGYLQKDDIKLPEIYAVFFKSYKKVEIPDIKAENKIKNIYFRTDKNSFIKKIKRAKEYIASGDIYQVNLAHRIDLEGFFQIEPIFFNLIAYQPAPYLMLIKDPEFAVVSASMELFLRKKGNRLVTKPIKGTRPRGKDPLEDRTLEEELKSSEKEKAENLMITDLMRNDFGRISKKGTVKVEKLFDIEKFSSLFQMVSTVSSILREDINLQDIIDNTFPPGSVTGAPKIRAMEIIAELEDYSRNVYCGSTFFIRPDMDFVMSVAIRQSIFRENVCSIYVGSGIVADSDPDTEYKETILKAKANLRSIGINSII